VFSCIFVNGQHVEYLGRCHSELSSEWISKEVTSCDGPGMIAAGTVGRWNNVDLLVPATPPSRLAGCGCINAYYELKVGHVIVAALSI